MRAGDILATMGLFGAAMVLTALAGLVFEWVRRKVAARLQSRSGPGPLQPVRDLVKLSRKETIVPDTAQRAVFMLMPLVALAGASGAALLVWGASVSPGLGFRGDLVLVLYLLALPGVALAVGGCASGNPLGAMGGARQMKMMLAAFAPLLLAVATALQRTARPGGQISLSLACAVRAQAGTALPGGEGMRLVTSYAAASFSGVIALSVAIISIHGLLGLRPFDCAEAPGELAGGVRAEYGGPMLAVWKLVGMMMFVTLPAFVVTLFIGGFDFTSVLVVGPVVALLGMAGLISVLSGLVARVRIDQAVRFFWLDLGLLGLLALVLAVAGY